MPKKSNFTIFAMQNFVQNTKKIRKFHLFCWDHVCKVNEWYLVDCFHREFRVSTQIMVRAACGGLLIDPSGHFLCDSKYLC